MAHSIAIETMATTIEYIGPPEIVNNAFILLCLITLIIFGAGGNKWRANTLKERGYKFVEIISAKSKNHAIKIARKKDR